MVPYHKGGTEWALVVFAFASEIVVGDVLGDVRPGPGNCGLDPRGGIRAQI